MNVTRVLLFWNSCLIYLQFFFIKGFEQVLRNDLIEAFLQGQKLGLNAMQETPVHVQPADNIREEEGEESQWDASGTANTDASWA